MAAEPAEVGELSQFYAKKHPGAGEGLVQINTATCSLPELLNLCWDSQEPTAPPVASQHNLLHNPKELRPASRPLRHHFSKFILKFYLQSSTEFCARSQGSPVDAREELDQHYSSEQLQSSFRALTGSPQPRQKCSSSCSQAQASAQLSESSLSISKVK